MQPWNTICSVPRFKLPNAMRLRPQNSARLSVTTCSPLFSAKPKKSRTESALPSSRTAVPVKVPEHLMLVGFEQFEVRAGSAVEDGLELHLESAVGAGEAPGRKIILFSVLHGYLKCDMVQLVESAVINERVFRRGGRYRRSRSRGSSRTARRPKARTRSTSTTCCDTSRRRVPSRGRQKFVRRQLEPLCTKLHPAGRAQAIDLLVVVKMPGLFKRRCNHEALGPAHP